ncbi:foldase protein PrsA [Paenibacillus gansuensis]|uniref:peptidylprolyl isomerase n=1 Tax=Paenibacillus gansuensis TaxID=306542 RepID=A0ABW5PCR2_9BACL
MSEHEKPEDKQLQGGDGMGPGNDQDDQVTPAPKETEVKFVRPEDLEENAARTPEEVKLSGTDPLDQPAAGIPAEQAPLRSNKAWMAASFILAALLVVSLFVSPMKRGAEAVATVNGQDISKDQVYDAMVKAGGERTVDSLITDELLRQELDKNGVQLAEADYEAELQRVKKNFPSDEEFNAALAQSGMTLDNLKEQISIQLKVKKLLEPTLKITDEQVKKYFDENKASFDTAEQVRASHILVKTKEEAEAIKKQLDGGADFAALAKEKSLDTGSKEQGGDLNYFGKGAMQKGFEDAAFKQKVDEIGIAQTEYGYHVIKVTDHKQAHKATFDEKKAEIKELLVDQEVGAKGQQYLADLKTKAQITNSLDKQADSAEQKTNTAS